MDGTYAPFEHLLEKHKVTAYKVSKATGISTSTLTSWKNGTYTPKPDKIKKIADFFGVPITYFYQDQDDTPATVAPQITADEMELVRKFRALTAEHQAALRLSLNAFYELDSKGGGIESKKDTEQLLIS